MVVGGVRMGVGELVVLVSGWYFEEVALGK